MLRFPSFVSQEAGKNLDHLQTWRQAYGSAVQHLKDKACIPAMACQSTYGVFGYFIGNETARQIYLKPRVNLRDIPPVFATEEQADAGNHPQAV
jgi:hypothetical protein